MKNFDDKFLDYLDEMEVDTVELSEEELQRIYKMEEEKIMSKKIIKPKFKWKIASGLVAACLILTVSVIVPNLNNGVSQQQQIINPCVNYSDLDSAEEAMGYDIMLPQSLPDGYKKMNITVISNELLSIDYTNDINEITYRTAQGSEDISGDFNIYTAEKTIKIKDINVTLKGNNDKINLAIWKTEGQTFSINDINGLSENEVIKIIENVEKK